MKKIVFLSVLFTMSFTLVFGQNPSDSIFTQKVFGGYTFYHQGMMIQNTDQLMSIIGGNQSAYNQIKSVKSTQTIVQILSYAGGFMIGYPIGTALAGGDPVWEMAGIGAGLILISIPFSVQVNKKILKAVDIYNGAYRETSFWDDKELMLSMTGNGMGFMLKF